MTFEKLPRFNEFFWFSGPYKIVKYTKRLGHGHTLDHYHAYRLICYPSYGTWGDYVPTPNGQKDKIFCFDECVEMCEMDAEKHPPIPRELKLAEIAKNNFIGKQTT